MREDTKLVKIFLDKSLINKMQVGFINDNITKTKESLKIQVRQSSIVDPFEVISNKDINNQNFDISYPKQIVTSNLFNYYNKNKEDFYDEIESEMYCHLSVILFDNFTGFANHIIKYCNKKHFEDIDEAIAKYQDDIIKINKQDIFCHTIFLKKKIGHQTEQLTDLECIGIIDQLFKEEFKSFKTIMKKNLAGIDSIEFLNQMKVYQDIILHQNSVCEYKLIKDFKFFNYSFLNETYKVKLKLDRNAIENLIEIYNQTVYIIYKALIKKYKLKNQIKTEVSYEETELFI